MYHPYSDTASSSTSTPLFCHHGMPRPARLARFCDTMDTRENFTTGSSIVPTDSSAASAPHSSTLPSTRAGSAVRDTNSRNAFALPST